MCCLKYWTAFQGEGGPRPFCDEYPFYSTLNGGRSNYENDTVSLMLLPEWESNKQRNLMSKLYSMTKIPRGKPFFSIGNVLLPFYYIKDRVFRPLSP